MEANSECGGPARDGNKPQERTQGAQVLDTTGVGTPGGGTTRGGMGASKSQDRGPRRDHRSVNCTVPLTKRTVVSSRSVSHVGRQQEIGGLQLCVEHMECRQFAQ